MHFGIDRERVELPLVIAQRSGAQCQRELGCVAIIAQHNVAFQSFSSQPLRFQRSYLKFNIQRQLTQSAPVDNSFFVVGRLGYRLLDFFGAFGNSL